MYKGIIDDERIINLIAHLVDSFSVDVSNSDIRRIILRYKSVFPMYRFFIHNNQYANGKDYGVPEWRISDFMWEEKINNNLI